MKKLIFIGLISFILGATWLTPLAFIAPHIAKFTNAISIQEPEGTIWNGKVNHLTINNLYLGNANWKVDPIQSLTSFSLKSKFKLKSNDLSTFGTASLSPNKKITFDQTQFDVNANLINTLQKNAKLSGNFTGFIKHAEIIESKVPHIDGIVNWQNGALESPIKLAPGDYRAVVKPDGQDLVAKLSSKEAPIELNGDIKLKSDWKFDTNLVTKSKNAGLMAMMKFAGKPQADGSMLIQQKGDLKPFLNLN